MDWLITWLGGYDYECWPAMPASRVVNHSSSWLRLHHSLNDLNLDATVPSGQ